MRRVLGTFLVLVLAALGAVATVSPAYADVTVRVSVPSGLPLNIRSSPSVGASVIGSLANGTAVSIRCYSRGDWVDGIGGSTNVWDRLSGGGWVSDGFLETGSNTPVVPACSTAPYKLPWRAGAAYTITQTPGNPYSHNDDYNRHAVDFAMPSGTPVLASAGGTVYFEGWSNGGGIMALIDHGGNRCSQYAHLSSTIINRGQWVAQGQQIGTSGATGNATGPHLHWNIVYCDSQLSREIPNSVERGTSYPTGLAPVSRNG